MEAAAGENLEVVKLFLNNQSVKAAQHALEDSLHISARYVCFLLL